MPCGVRVSRPAVIDRSPSPIERTAHWVRYKTDRNKIMGFLNPWPSAYDFSFPELFKVMLQHKMLSGRSRKPNTDATSILTVAPNFVPGRTSTTALRTVWLGHACCFAEFPRGLRVLFDPVFEDRCSPLPWLGHKRMTPVPCNIADLPFVDVVIISHSHYDHLSYPSVVAIHKRFPLAHFFVPSGLKDWFLRSGISCVTELDWWEDTIFTFSDFDSTGAVIEAKISCLPSQHTSARTPFDKAATLWASWSVSSGGRSVYFAGDTGYRKVPFLPENVDDWGPEFLELPVCPAFKQIGNLRGPFDIGLIPIGAYRPRHVLSAFHSNPFDSVAIFKDTRCKKAVAIHWGTWALAEEDITEPPELLKQALMKNGLSESGLFEVCGVGGSVEV